ncbi:MAG: hypothetical protein A3F69_01960 [Acidobacteria bacterium RIFCSPLOWO2_12_FULL_66_10]|nr:MAG: hypothetical protein A3F69_01960 [Acidobacteria bacterium RIFCSPLOWO2_12_FULL_66_10]
MSTQAARSWGAAPLSAAAEARFIAGVEYCGRFFVGESEAHKALYKLTALLDTDGLPYAIIGAFALLEYGHRRVTVDVDLVMREEDLQEFKRRHLGKGYAERVPGTGRLLDTEFGVNVDVLSTGRFPGDDKPKPIAFPDPATTAVRGTRFALLPMARYIELKLASGMVAPHRAKDLVDVQELIRSAKLARVVASTLDPWVRETFLRLWDLAQIADPF